jgi:hypothetical protein
MTNGHPPATGPQILEKVSALDSAVELLCTRLDDKFVREQQRDGATEQILLGVRQLTEAIVQLQKVVRSEQEHTRRALLMHFGSADLVNERGT